MEGAVSQHLEREALLDVGVRVWAEIGRARMALGDAVALSQGAVVDLDRAPEEPVELYVNVFRYGTGRLVLVESDWAVLLESVHTDGLAGS